MPIGVTIPQAPAPQHPPIYPMPMPMPYMYPPGMGMVSIHLVPHPIVLAILFQREKRKRNRSLFNHALQSMLMNLNRASYRPKATIFTQNYR